MVKIKEVMTPARAKCVNAFLFYGDFLLSFLPLSTIYVEMPRAK
jgi:hypothetical protein